MKNKLSLYMWIGFMVVFWIFLYFFNSALSYDKPADIENGNVYEKAKVTKVITESLGDDPDFPKIKIGRQELELKILTGEHKGKKVIAKNFVGRVDNKPGKLGSEFVISSYDNFITTAIVNYSRESYIYILLIIFLLIVIYFGKIKGIKSIFSLFFTLICVIYLFIPLIIKGVDPIIGAIFVVFLSTGVTLLSLNGYSKKTFIACVSCISCTMIAGISAYLVGKIARISTLNTQEAENLLFISSNTSLKVNNLFFAGILIASLGAVMDTTMSIASALDELKRLNSKLKFNQLLHSGMNIGKDIMGTMTNTLILAFTGSSINILIILFMYDRPYIQLVNLDMMVIEIVQGLCGSMAVVLSIPITTFIAAKVLDK